MIVGNGTASRGKWMTVVGWFSTVPAAPVTTSTTARCHAMRDNTYYEALHGRVSVIGETSSRSS